MVKINHVSLTHFSHYFPLKRHTAAEKRGKFLNINHANHIKQMYRQSRDIIIKIFAVVALIEKILKQMCVNKCQLQMYNNYVSRNNTQLSFHSWWAHGIDFFLEGVFLHGWKMGNLKFRIEAKNNFEFDTLKKCW